MADRVSILTAALFGRRSEFEAAQSGLAEHETLLERASAELAASNGDFSIWEAIDQRVRFETRQVERYRGIVEQARGNAECASKALETAQREAATEGLQSARAERQARMREIGAGVARLHHEACALLTESQPLQNAELLDVAELQKLGVSVQPNHALYELWVSMMKLSPGLVPSFWGDVSVFEKDIVRHVGDILKMERESSASGAPEAMRARFGDTSAVLPPPPPEQPAKPWQAEAYRESIEARRYQGLSYSVECWCVPPDGRTEHRLKLASALPIYETVLSEELVELEHGLSARLVTLQGGRRVLLAPDKSLVSRVVDAAKELLNAST